MKFKDSIRIESPKGWNQKDWVAWGLGGQFGPAALDYANQARNPNALPEIDQAYLDNIKNYSLSPDNPMIAEEAKKYEAQLTQGGMNEAAVAAASSKFKNRAFTGLAPETMSYMNALLQAEQTAKQRMEQTKAGGTSTPLQGQFKNFLGGLG